MLAETGTLSDYFVPRKQAGEAGLPVLSVTMNDGLVLRSSLDRRTESAMLETAHALVEPGDIAYNMMRMWQGASGLCHQRANISPAYVVMTPRANTDPQFAAHWLKSKDAIDLLWAYSHGLTEDRLRLYPDDFLSIPATFPPLPEQQRIASVLDAWDTAIATTERLVEAKRRQSRDVTRRLMAQSNESVMLGSLGSLEKGRGLAKTELTDAGIPCLRYAEIYTLYGDTTYSLVSRTSEAGARAGRELMCGDIVFAASGETAEEIGKAVAYLGSERAVVGGDTVVLTGHGQVAGYLARLLNSPDLVRQKTALGKGHSVVHIHAPDLARLMVTLPPTDDQKIIAAAFEAIENEIGGLQAIAECLRQQKRGLMQLLLTGKLRVPESIDRLLPAPLLASAA